MNQLADLLTHWLAALNSPDGRTENVRKAFTEDATLYRYGVFDEAGQLAETFTGVDAISAWLDRTPTTVTITFALDGDPTPAPDHDLPGAVVIPFSYGYDGFLNGGLWIAVLGDDGRIGALEHHPRELTEEQRAYSPPSTGRVIIGNANVIHSHTHETDAHNHSHDHGD